MEQKIEGIIKEDQLDRTYPQVQAAIARLVWENENLRHEFVNNPKQAIEQNLGIKFAEDINIKCIDAEDSKAVYNILPHHPSKALGVNFSDDQLDAVAGGLGFSAMYASMGGQDGPISLTGMGLMGQ